MRYSAYAIFLLSLLSINFLFHISYAILTGDDKILIAFLKSQQQIRLSEYSKQKYEAHLSIMYYMRMNWQCDKIEEQFKEFEKTECQKYRKYLDILYEYLFREYFGIPTVKPKFVFKKRIEIEGPLIYAVNCLAKISQFYFKPSWYEYCDYKLNNYEPKLLNEERLNYEVKFENQPKVPINEMILQLAIETANELQTNEILDEIIREIFEENLKKMFKKEIENPKENYRFWDANQINNDKHFIIVHSKFDDEETWTKDALFSEFIKGLATNFKKFFRMAKEYSNIEEINEYLTQKYEGYLGVMYLMRENWHCEKIAKKFNEDELKICQKIREYLDHLYEYLFRIYAEAKNPEVSKQLPPLVKPIFIMRWKSPLSLKRVFINLNDHSKCFWQKGEKNSISFYGIWDMYLANEEELDDEMKKEKSGKNAPKNEKETKIIQFRNEFEGIMENKCKNAKDEKAKFEKAIENAANNVEKYILRDEYYDKIGIFNSSPFS